MDGVAVGPSVLLVIFPVDGEKEGVVTSSLILIWRITVAIGGGQSGDSGVIDSISVPSTALPVREI